MAITADVLNSLVSITQFNKGQASKIFDRLRTERQLVVLKNNAPSAVILSPEEYERLPASPACTGTYFQWRFGAHRSIP